MKLSEIARYIDDAILDKFFQPLANYLPSQVTPWSLGTSFHIGAILFYIVSFVGPLTSNDVSIDLTVQIVFSIAWMFTLILIFQKFRPHGQQNAMNPSRIMLRSMRLWSLIILLVGLYDLDGIEYGKGLWDTLGILSRAALVIGLYLMACQPPPPGTRRNFKLKHRLRRLAATGSGSYETGLER